MVLSELNGDRLLTAAEVQTWLLCSKRTLERHVANKVAPPSFRVGGKRYWRQVDFLRWLDERAAPKRQTKIE
jgi:predicted DNA-binding transcriptional regulator AlpA